MKKFILMLSVAMFTVCLFAISVSATNINGIEYSLKNGEATVTSANQSCTLDVVNIPETVEYEGVTYTVTAIDNSAFRNNATVKSITTPSTIKSIGEHAFRSMSELETIVINASAEFTAFSDAEVYECKKLVSADLSGCVGLTDMGGSGTYDHTFTNCSSLTSVKLPQGLVNIGRAVFSGCSSLAEIDIPDTVTIIEYQAFNSTALVNVKIPQGVTRIEDYAFQSCKSLESLNIPEGVTYFGCNNFQYTKVTRVVFPSTLTTMTKDVFNSVKCIDTVVFANSDVSGYTGSVLSNCGPLNNVFYAGSDASVLVSQFSSLNNHAVVSYEQYLEDIKNPEFAGYTKTIIYGTENCKGCGDVISSESGFVFEDLLSEMYTGVKCDNCGAKTVIDTFAPVFEDLGYSTFELNGYCSIVQGFKVNYASLKEYNKELTDKQIGSFGVIAVAQSKVEGVAFDENGNALSGVLTSEIKSGHDYFEIKVANISLNDMLDENTSYADAKLHMCAYVKIGDRIYYVTEDYVGTELGEAVSYNSLK